MRRRGPLGERLLRSAGFSLAGGAGFALFATWSTQHWWVGPAVIGALALVLAALWHW